jgi:hypothetical protein
MRLGPGQDFLDKKIYIEFYDSPKVSKILQNNLKARGFNVVESPDRADRKLFFHGHYTITKACKTPINGTLGKLLESAIEESPSMSNDYRVTTGPGTVVLTSAVFGVFSFVSLVSMTEALVQMTGFSTWVNRKISGDKSCENPEIPYSSEVRILVTEGGLFHTYKEGEFTWKITASATALELPLGVVASDAIEYAIQPVYDLKPVSTQPQ